MTKRKNNTLNIESRIKANGISLKVKGESFNLIYPKKIWKAYPQKQKVFLNDNLVYLLTINIPFVAPVDTIKYKNISLPYLKPYIDALTIDGIPSAVHNYEDSTFKILKDFNDYNYIFKDKKVKLPSNKKPLEVDEETAIVPLSFGKDSLTTLGILKEAGIKPICIYINDTESPSENKIKLKMAKRFPKEQNIKVYTITNEIEKLNDFELWDTKEGCLGYMHMIMGFCLMLMPFARYFKAKYIVLGNQQDMNFSFINKDSFLTYPAPDQTHRWLTNMSRMVKEITPGNIQITSVIEPLVNITLMGLLHNRYPDLGQYEVSCDCLDASNEPRWCHNCSKCARLGLFMKAWGIDTSYCGFKHDLLEMEHKKLYSLFGGKKTDQYEESKEAKEQQFLAFYLACKRGERGELIDYFKKNFLSKDKNKVEKLKDKYLKIYDIIDMSEVLKKKVRAIFKEQLEAGQ